MNVKAWTSAFRIRLHQGMQYRAAAFAGLCTQFFWGMMLILVYRAFYAGASGEPPMSLSQTVSYVWLHQAFLALVMFWYRDPQILGLITDGGVAYELCRPAGLYALWYARLLAGRLSACALRFWPILIAAFLLPDAYRLHPPATPAALAGFLAAMTIGLAIMVALTMFVYEWTMVTLDPSGPMAAFGALGEFLNGGIIPVPLMPDWLQPIVLALPFRFSVDLPFRIWNGDIPPGQIPGQLAFGLCWLVALLAAGLLWMRALTRRMVVTGG